MCDLYETAAVVKAKAKTELSATCTCKGSQTECGENWRGAMKHEFKCVCELRGSCSLSTCKGSDVTATATASAKCRKSNCSCVKKSDDVCGKGMLGGKKYTFNCECP